MTDPRAARQVQDFTSLPQYRAARRAARDRHDSAIRDTLRLLAWCAIALALGILVALALSHVLPRAAHHIAYPATIQH